MSKGFPPDWRKCIHHYELHKCALCDEWCDPVAGQYVVERQVKPHSWKGAEHMHAQCALEEALRLIEQIPREEAVTYIKHKWTPKEPTS